MFIFTGCANNQTHVSTPNFQKTVQNKQKIIVVPPAVKVYEVSSAGQELIDEWSQTATENMKDTLASYIKDKSEATFLLFNEKDFTAEQNKIIQSSNGLLSRVGNSIHLHALPNAFIPFKEKKENFNYTLGEELALAGKSDDLFLFITATDQVQTAGKKTAETVKLIVGALLGVGIGGDYGGYTFARVSLVDGKTGNILWYNYYLSKGTDDLRQTIGSTNVIKSLLHDLPKI
jgi:hypothetical protein